MAEASRETGRVVAAVLEMYRQGWFPMAERGRLEWVQPEARAIIPLDDGFHVPGTLRSRVRSGRFRVTRDVAFGRVIRACAARRPGRESTWLSGPIIGVFEALHEAGRAHSVEAWVDDAARGAVLVGGLYGLALGSVFCGESMFSRPEDGGRDASKVCLVHLVEHLRARGFTMLDAQLHNPHLEQFGLREMPRDEFVAYLEAHADAPVTW